MRCAIYTRKSSHEGLDQPFSSLDAQRLSCSHFIASQASEGWVERSERYDDGGHSGGTLARPALRRLLQDVQSGGIDMVVVYKIDRLSRSLRDFVRLIEIFERHAVTFASVTQQFSTTNSMGRLTFNILLAFAQFERELTSERIRDKFAALRANGMRPSGGRPFGYQVVGRRLEIDKAEAATVNRIFATFIQRKSATPIPALLSRDGLLHPRGRPFTLAFVRHTLRNRVYLGEMVHAGQWMPGAHPPIISDRIWARAQAVRAPHIERWSKRREGYGLLAGLLFGPDGPLLHDIHANRGIVYRYYGPPRRLRNQVPKCANGRYRAAALEQFILGLVDPDGRFSRDPTSEVAAAVVVRSLVERVDVGPEIAVRLKTGAVIQVPCEPWLRTSRLQGRTLVITGA